MRQMFLMVGVSGSGKSSIVRKLVAAKQAAVFSLDSCRVLFMHAEHAGQWWSDLDTPESRYAKTFEYCNAHPKEFDNFVTKTWRAVLQADTLVVDNTNLTVKSRRRWVTESRAKGFSVTAINVVTPLQTVICRQKTRGDKSVPEQVVRDMYMRQQEVLVPEEADRLVLVDGTAPFDISVLNG